MEIKRIDSTGFLFFQKLFFKGLVPFFATFYNRTSSISSNTLAAKKTFGASFAASSGEEVAIFSLKEIHFSPLKLEEFSTKIWALLKKKLVHKWILFA